MNKFLKGIWPILLVVAFSGCASHAVDGVESITRAGVTSYHNAPVIGEEGDIKLGEITDVVFGKEYGSFWMKLSFDEKTHNVTNLEVKALDVGAFAGQAGAAEAIVSVQKSLTELGIAGTDAASNVLLKVIEAYIPAPASLAVPIDAPPD